MRKPPVAPLLTAAASWALLFLFSGCGYTLQNSSSPLLEKEGIRRVYVSPFRNDSFNLGIENVLYNAIVRKLASRGRVEVVSQREAADAVLQGVIGSADMSVLHDIQASQLQGGKGLGIPDYVRVASTYQAGLVCSFTLVRRNPPPRGQAVLWSGNFAKHQPFPASTAAGVYGTTSTLINDSELDRVLGDLANRMASDVHDSMLAMF